MQAACPNCAQRLTVDDARAPDRPFAVKCPRCANPVRFPGRSAAPAAPAPSAATAAMEEAESVVDLGRARRELAASDQRQVLVGLPDRALATTLTQPLASIGCTVEVLDTPEEGGRLLEQGAFDIVVTSPAFAVGREETVYQRILRLSPEGRRRMFVVLVDEQFATGDTVQAFAAQADLVVNPRDAASVEALLLGTMAERRRLYQVFLDARKRHEAAD